MTTLYEQPKFVRYPLFHANIRWKWEHTRPHCINNEFLPSPLRWGQVKLDRRVLENGNLVVYWSPIANFGPFARGLPWSGIGWICFWIQIMLLIFYFIKFYPFGKKLSISLITTFLRETSLSAFGKYTVALIVSLINKDIQLTVIIC